MPVGAHIRVTSSGIQQVTEGFERTRKAVDRVGGSALQATNKLQTMVGGVTSKLQGLYGLIGGVGLVAGGKRVLDYRDALGQLQVEARLGTDEMRAIDGEILKMAGDSGIAASELTAMLSVFQGFGGALQFGRDMMADMVTVAKATGAPMETLATIASTLHKTLGMTREEVVEAFAAMKAMSIAGTITMAQAAPELPQLLGLGKGLGFQGGRGVRQIGAAHQVIGELLPQSSDSRTALKAVLRDLEKNAGALGKKGVKIFDKPGVMRDLDAIFVDLMKKTGGIKEGKGGFGKYFSDEGGVAAAAFANSFDKQLNSWRPGSNVEAIFGAGKGASSADLQKDAALRDSGIAAESERVKKALASLEAGLLKHGGRIIQWFAGDMSKALMLIGGGVLGAKSIFPFLKGLAGLRGGWKGLLGEGGPGGAVGGAVGLLGGGAQKVEVVNWPGGGIPGAGVAAGQLGQAGTAAGGAATWLGKLGAAAQVAQGVMAAFGVGYGIGTAIDEATGASDWISDQMFRLLNPTEAAKRDWGQESVTVGTADEREAEGRANVDKFLVSMRGGKADAPGESQKTGDHMVKGGAAGLPPIIVEVRLPNGIDSAEGRVLRGPKQ